METSAQIAIVTGAGSGIGRRAALALVEASFHVVLAGRRAEALEETGRMAASAGEGAGRTLAVPTDVTDPTGVDHLFQTAVETFGRVDLVFNNAGTFAGAGAIDAIAYDTWLNSIGVNLNGAFLVAQAAFRTMKAQAPQGGRIINNGSISAHVPRPNAIAYTAAKHAITGMTKSLAIEGRPFSIACGQIDIGNAATDMTVEMGKGMLQADGRLLPEATFDAAHVAQTIVHMARLPLNANIPFVTVMATTMPYLGRG
ncbi:SDR family oxidoreductase [Mangrovicella endophytica]|uniref:SDR family oxidoreductase n=1 Tax=Mangrovicella endophytica TaxID=2066697 RepID=UPI0018E45DA5|nr:SDR family oxidoreductase [Mangrovicella endophytica]